MKFEVFVISLKQDEERRNALKKAFKNFDNFKIISAVDGRKMGASEYYSVAIKSYLKFGKFLSPSEVGCSLSHILAYEEFLKSGSDFALILEDDVLGDDFGIERAFLLGQKMDDGVLICGCQDGLNGRFSAFGKLIDEKNELFLVSKFSKSVITRACAYVVSKSSAKALLEAHSDGICIADLWQVLLKNQNMYFCNIFAHPIDLVSSNLEQERALRGKFRPNFKTHFRSLVYILSTRFQMIFGYKRIFKR